jgi:aryl-alcohol dehydrogenase-like predicted oxidoreductase
VEHRRLGRSGLVVSRLALGTMTWGRDTDAADAAGQWAAFRDAGGTLVDTADRFADGEAERILGGLLAGTARDEIVVATKAGAAGGPGPLQVGASRRRLLAALDASLARLGVDHVDLWQVHRFDEGTPLEETLAALDTAVGSGRARYVGVAHYNGWQTAAAACWQRAVPGRAPLVAAAVEYSLLARGVEREVVPAARHAGAGLLAWSPLGRGVLTGKYRGGTPADSRAAAGPYAGFVRPYLTEGAARIVDAVVTAADGLGASPAAVALAWVRDRPGVVAPVLGARTHGQLAAALAVERMALPAEIRAALDEVSAPPWGLPERGSPDREFAERGAGD